MQHLFFMLVHQLENFRIIVADFFNENEQICKEILTTLPLATTISDYHCFDCTPNLNGSMVIIRLLHGNKRLSLCDVKVDGQFTGVLGKNFKEIFS